MGFMASRLALRFGRDSVAKWLDGEGAILRRRFAAAPLQRPGI